MAAKSEGVTASVILDYLRERVILQRTDAELVVKGVTSLTPGLRGRLSFASGQSQEVMDAIASSESSLVLVTPQAFHAMAETPGPSRIAVNNPRREFARLVRDLFTTTKRSAISPAAIVETSAIIGTGTTIGPGAHIAAGVVIGSNCWIGTNAVLLEGTVVGEHTSIGPNTTIGHVGFGYEREDDGSPVQIPHSGGVTIGSHVDIGANSCVDRGTLDDTVIEDHVKVDNLVHIAHNCHIEEGAFVIATAILCGGVRVGARAWIAPNVSVREKLRVGDDAVVGLASTVIRDVPSGATVVGSPAKEVVR